MKYITGQELREIQNIVSALNDKVGKNITFGPIRVYDSNGDTLCYVSYSDHFEYAMYFENPEDEEKL